MWFIGAGKGSKLMRDWRETYMQFTVEGVNQYRERMVEEDVYMRRIDE